MGKGKTEKFIMKLRDLPFICFNLIFYVLFFGVLISNSLDFTDINKASDYFISISILFFTASVAFNTVIQTFHFDNNFIPILYENKKLVTIIYDLPANWLIKMSVIRGLYYSSAITTMSIKQQSWAPIVNYLAELDKFKRSLKLYNKIMAWTIFSSLPTLLLGCIIGAILKHYGI